MSKEAIVDGDVRRVRSRGSEAAKRRRMDAKIRVAVEKTEADDDS